MKESNPTLELLRGDHSTVVNDSVDGYDGEHETENSNKSVAFRLRGEDGGRHGLGAVVRAS